jgi:phosphoribosylcarboxyaminoimidazole (NCAIR) mutase
MLEYPRTKVASVLHREVERLLNPPNRGWVCTELREAMGSPWDTPTIQSAVDFFHALLDMCGVSNIGYQTERVTRTPRDPGKTQEVEVTQKEGFRAHLAVAGMHESLSSVFSRVETIDVPTSEFKHVQTVVDLTYAPVLVMEVGRNTSGELIQYGVSTPYKHITMDIGTNTYTLMGVVCRKDTHYVAIIFRNSKWWVYNDLMENGVMLECAHPELTPYKPSRYGELFFYK